MNKILLSTISRKLLMPIKISLFLCCFLANMAQAKTLLVLGDSLSAAYGIPVEKGWVALLTTKLQATHSEWTIVNASISGETTSGGLARLKPLLDKNKPDLVLVELGANDGMRGLSLVEMKNNLQAIIDQSQSMGAKVAICAMKLPPNYGVKYTALFEKAYLDIAEKNSTATIPFLLEGVAGHPELIQADGLHPIESAQAKIVENVWPSLEKLLSH